jgi:DNA-binding GntR family transcriptional regulator
MAVAILRDEGLVVTIGGRGAFVSHTHGLGVPAVSGSIRPQVPSTGPTG